MRHDTFTVGTTDYRREFWNKTMRGSEAAYEKIKGGNVGNNMFVLLTDSNRKFMDALSSISMLPPSGTHSAEASLSDAQMLLSDFGASTHVA